MKSAVVRVARSYRASATRVFDAWIDPALAGRFLFATATQPMTDVEIDARVSGAFRFAAHRDEVRIEQAGRYVALTPPRRMAFELDAHDGMRSTLVKVDIAPRGTGCRLTLTHEGVPADRAARAGRRWAGILYGLGETLAAARTASNVARGPRATHFGDIQCITC